MKQRRSPIFQLLLYDAHDGPLHAPAVPCAMKLHGDSQRQAESQQQRGEKSVVTQACTVPNVFELPHESPSKLHQRHRRRDPIACKGRALKHLNRVLNAARKVSISRCPGRRADPNLYPFCTSSTLGLGGFKPSYSISWRASLLISGLHQVLRSGK